eukprot:CAMPEP_0194369660 /NCGR_PEP_ID=MMETSP0174-20130528/17989_1 /TAXON_ID=216777 /ORGANISM="Proboscia alata, Strain PI-D3" /LENGTH=67 /DNA_ID=CAMNT_0039146737 /DNA_START=402 /DNA_END=605 /DNA_ORIENTATION=+
MGEETLRIVINEDSNSEKEDANAAMDTTDVYQKKQETTPRSVRNRRRRRHVALQLRYVERKEQKQLL